MLSRPVASLLRGYLWVTRPHPGRGYLGKMAAWLDPRDVFCEVSPGVRVRLSLANSDHITIWQGRYEEHDELTAFLGLLSPGMTVLDIGSNIGMYAAAISRKVGPSGTVYAFEPMPHLHRHLVDTITLNGCTNVVIRQAAVSDTHGRATFHVGRWDSLGSLVRSSSSGGQTVEVETLTIDDFVTAAKVEQVHAVKIDVEGAEPMVLQGMRKLLASPTRPILLVEHNYTALKRAGASAEKLFSDIVAHGYLPHVILNGKLIAVSGLVEPERRYLEPTMNYIFTPVPGPVWVS